MESKGINDASQNYDEGIKLLKECEASFSKAKYRAGIACLVNAFSESEKKEEILRLLSDIVYAPNATALESMYEENRKFLAADRLFADLPEFSALPFLIFPADEECVYLFDCERRIFVARGQIHRRLHCLAALALLEASTARAARFLRWLREELADERGKQIFEQVRECLDRKQNGTDLRAQIGAYHRLRPDCEKYEWMMGRYFANENEYALAEKWARRGLAKRGNNFSLKLLLAETCCRMKKYAAAAAAYVSLAYTPQSLARNFSGEIEGVLQKALEISPEVFAATLWQMSLHASQVIFAPIIERHFLPPGQAAIAKEQSIILGRYLDGTENSFFVGAYNEVGYFNARAYEIEQWSRYDFKHQRMAAERFRFDLLKGKLCTDCSLQAKGEPFLIALMPTREEQEIHIASAGRERVLKLGRYETNFLRVESDADMHSAAPFLLGNKVSLRHHPKRRRLVLRILIDALSGAQLREENFQSMPNVKRFFAKGVIFTNAYAVAECTYPSLPTIETGLYQHHSQIFHPKAYMKISPEIVTTSRQMKEYGYYCTNLVGVSEGIYNGISDGYDRIVMKLDSSRAEEGVNRAIRQLDAFRETDQFVSLHFCDTHPPYPGAQLRLDAQTAMPLAERLDYDDDLIVPSVRRICSERSIRWVQKAMGDTDRSLKRLFDFIEENYRDDEIVVSLYSDHGNAMLSEDPFLLAEKKSCAALMLRGANVPGGGTISDEMVSIMDLYSIMGHLAGYAVDERVTDSRLPKIFGGSGREYAVSQATYPGQTYKLCIRTTTHEFRLETADLIAYDGRIRLSPFTWHMYKRTPPRAEIFDLALLEYFLDIAYSHVRSMHDPVTGAAEF